MTQTTIQAALSDATSKLEATGISSARLDSELLLGFVTGHDRVWLHAHAEDSLDPAISAKYDEVVAVRATRTPLVHITGTREFYGLDIKVTPAVLTPRTETEVMVDLAIKYAPINSSLIDLGTGSGAIAIAIAKHRPDLSIIATDISETELSVARDNDSSHKTNIKFVASDLFDSVDGTFDTVVCNLPYLTDSADLMPEVRREPGVALFGGPDGLNIYRRFLGELPAHLSPGGYLFTECDPWQQEELTNQATHAGLARVAEDYFILGFRLGS